jgi:hypothetical protein
MALWSALVVSLAALARHTLSGSTRLPAFPPLDYHADDDGRETGQHQRPGGGLKCVDLAACPAMEMSEPAGVHGGVDDQQAGRLPPETGPSMQDASEVQNEHGHDDQPRARKHEYPERHGHLASLSNDARSLASVKATILPFTRDRCQWGFRHCPSDGFCQVAAQPIYTHVDEAAKREALSKLNKLPVPGLTET